MKNWKSKISVLITVLAVLLGALSGNTLLAGPNHRPAAVDIPSGSMIIGTHLIAFNALNQEILEIALKSADATQRGEPEQVQVQDLIYYKSELNNGVWHDITAVEAITDITLSSDNIVPNRVIDELQLTHWTRRDGTTIEFASGAKVNLHELDSPQDPANIPELEVLNMEKEVREGKYEALVEADQDEEQINKAKKVLDSMDRVFEQVESEELDQLQELLDSYDDFSYELRNEKKVSESMLEIAQAQKELVKAARDLDVFETVLERLNEETVVAGMLEDAELLSRYGTAIDELSQEITRLQMELEVEEEEEQKILDRIYADDVEELQAAVAAGAYADGFEKLQRLQAIENIHGGRIQQRELELALIVRARDLLLAELGAEFATGETEAYSEAKGEGEARAVLDGIKDGLMTAHERRLTELEELQDYYLFRTESDPALQQEAKRELVEALNEMRDTLPADDFYADAAALLEVRIAEHVRDLARHKAGKDEEMAAEWERVEGLRARADELEEAFFTAAEKGDAAELERLQAELAAANDLLDAAQNEAAQQYRGLLDEADRLRESIAAAATAQARQDLRAELDDLLAAKAGLEPLLEEKARNSLQYLEELEDELQEALDSNNLQRAATLADELMDLMGMIPDNLFSEAQQQAREDGIVAQIKEQAEQLQDRGNEGAAQNMAGLASDLAAALAGKRAVVPEPPLEPAYYLNFIDHGVKITQPYLELDGTIYVPARLLFEALGAAVTWQPEQGRTVVQDPGWSMLLEYTVGSDTAYVNDRRVKLPLPVDSIRGTIHIPLEMVKNGYRLSSETINGIIYLQKK